MEDIIIKNLNKQRKTLRDLPRITVNGCWYVELGSVEQHFIYWHIASLIEILEGEVEWEEEDLREYPYERTSPFPGESVEHHLRTYGHLPEIGCCKYDQFSKDETDVYNEAKKRNNRPPQRTN